MRKRIWKARAVLIAALMSVVLCGCSLADILAESDSEGFLDRPVTEVILSGDYKDAESIFEDALNSVFGTTEDETSDDNYTGSETTEDDRDDVPQGTNSDTSLDGYLRVDFVDVGQADFIVLEYISEDGDTHYMTIDGGNVADGQLVYSYLESRGIEHLDAVWVTHGHEDHCGGVSSILTCCTTDVVYCSVTEYDTKAFRNVVAKAGEQGLSIVIPEAGSTYTLGDATIEILGPVKDYDEPNDMSLVMKVVYGDTSFLFTGDMESTSEADVLDAGYDVSADVLKVAHHGSYTSSSYRFLREVLPTYAVISSSREDAPDYDHPHDVVLSRLRDADATLYRTDLQGTITCYSDGENITFSVEQNAGADVFYELEE